uniref:TolB family protein n=1 Tax=Desertifilum tharense IPPAS B-1220 TaxID=1781255 RepID=A0ACD5GRV4_9CYAN
MSSRTQRYISVIGLLLFLWVGSFFAQPGDARTRTPPLTSEIAFVSNRRGNEDVYLLQPRRSQPLNLTNHPADDATASWSPDGQFIAFRSFRNGDAEIYRMNADGTNQVNLTKTPGEIPRQLGRQMVGASFFLPTGRGTTKFM